MIRYIIAAGLIAFTFAGGSSKPVGDTNHPGLAVSASAKDWGWMRRSTNIEDRRDEVQEASNSFAERFDAVYTSRFTCRTDSECEAAFFDEVLFDADE